MKKSLLFAIFAIFLLARVSYADGLMLYSSGYENGSNVSVVIPPSIASQNTFAAYFKMNYSGNDYMGYCVDYAAVDWGILYSSYTMIPLPNEVRYKEAAWLFETYGINPATSGKNVQLAIWEVMFDPNPQTVKSPAPGAGFYATSGDVDLDLADGYIQEVHGKDLTGLDFSNYRLLVSPIPNPNGNNGYYGEPQQDFIVKTPEPGMLALLGIGLLGLFLASRRRVIS
jgi:hypothetical protein